VAGEASGRVNRQRFQVSYFEGEADEHAMDADVLGPALVAYSKLLRAANAELNKDNTSVRVLVDSEFEHRCFQVNFELIQTVIQHINDLLDGTGIKNATDLLKAIGMIGMAGATVTGGVLGYLKWKNGRKVESAQAVEKSPGTLVVKAEGDGNTINITNNVYCLAQNSDVLDAIEGTLAPITGKKETSKIEFREDDKAAATVLTHEEVRAIIASASDRGESPPIAVEEEKPKTVTAVLYTYGPVFDAKAPNWRFRYRNKPIYADVRDTTIAKDAVARGKSSMDDRYRVRMQVKPPANEGGEPHYKIVEVLDFELAPEQGHLRLKKPPKAKKAKRAKPAA
jgi:hypothetical protein